LSIQTAQNNIERTQREIQALQQKLTNETKNEATKTERVYQIKRSINQYTNQLSIQSKMREIESAQREIVNIQKKKADLTKQLGDKTTALHRYQQELFREQDREQKKLLDSAKRREDEIKRMRDHRLNQVKVDSYEAFNPSISSRLISEPQYDAFISHASEDKESVVRPLAEKLRELGFRIWYDEFQLKVGDSLRRSIDKGLVNSKFGIVVLSPAFFSKNWPKYELDGMVAKENSGNGKVILPLWHKVSKDEVMSYSPPLADKVALNTAMLTIDELANELGNILKDTAS
jgi:hypothetical protein